MAFGSVMIAGLAGAVRAATHRVARLPVVSAKPGMRGARSAVRLQTSIPTGRSRRHQFLQSPLPKGGVPCWRCRPFRALLVQPEWLTFDALELETAGVVGDR